MAGFYPEYDEDYDWFEEQPDTAGLADVLRHSLRDEYSDVSDEDMGDALANVLDSMSPAESVNFASALSQIGKSASQVLSDPMLGQIARAALPIAGGSLGTVIGGPVGTALGSKLGAAAASALPGPTPGRTPAPPAAVVPQAGSAPGAQPAAAPLPGVAPAAPVTPAAAVPVSPVADGSAAAARALVLAQHPGVLQGLLAAALGQYGQTRINGVPVAQMLGMLSEAAGEAAADADELMYLRQGEYAGDGESIADPLATGPDRSLYARLLEVDNAELAEAIELDGMDTW